MFPYPSTLETLIAFGVVFLLGLAWARFQRPTCRCRAIRRVERPA